MEFAALAALVFNLSPTMRWRQIVLLAANLAFLASFSAAPVAYLPFAAFIALGFVCQLGTRGSPRLFLVQVTAILGVFFWLKRYNFVPGGLFLPFPYLLVGLSYVFFRVLHVVIDRHQGALPERLGLLSYLNYTLNFCALTSGPIQRYEDYRRQEVEPQTLDLVVMGDALERVVVGYFKVAIVSMLLFQAHHVAIDALARSGGVPQRAWLGMQVVAVYPVYLYFNFSGYVDVVIGVGRFFRLILPENFDRPFSSENFLVFWSRWHITLSEWLKTYVYNSLVMAGLRRADAAMAPHITVAAFFVTFFLVGLWHGQTSEFLFFGVLQGGGVAANKLYQILVQARLGRRGYRALAANPLYRTACRGLTFTWFAFTLLWFWSNWQQIGAFSHELGPAALVVLFLALFGGATLVLAAMEGARTALQGVTWGGRPAIASRYLRTSWNTALVVIVVGVTILLDSPAPDIVYKAF